MNTLRPLLTLALAASWLLAAAAEPEPMRQEYPRPQFEREAWINLNGQWDFYADPTGSNRTHDLETRTSYPKKINVPFCMESPLSGIGCKDFINSVWYRRWIDIPQEWDGRRILLHFGAADYEATIYIDGRRIATHYGTGSSFAVDLTRAVRAGGHHNLAVWVRDRLLSGLQPLGKQSPLYNSFGCLYTRTTGIWQTVWLEAVAHEGLQSAQVVTDIDQSRIVVRPRFYSEADPAAGVRLRVSLYDGKRRVATATAPCSNTATLVLPVKNQKLWSPESPFLYDLIYEVVAGDRVVDRVKSYAGMRKVSIQDGHFCLNNRPYFQILVLDQGFYPDGIWTAPSDSALRRDIELSKAAGFNGARLHQKVFEERYHYWADRLGYLTWGEAASWGMDVNNPEANRNFIAEWTEIVERDRSHPSIVVWTPLNETWDCEDTGVYTRFVHDLYRLTKALDPTRPVNDASGDAHVKTDIWSVHTYARADKLAPRLVITPGQEPYRSLPDKPFLATYDGQPFMLDEWGGLPWIRPEERATSWGYGSQIETLDEFYSTLEAEIEVIAAAKAVDGVCYTQLTDVEQEKNGIYFYDRTPKFDLARIRQLFAKLRR